MGLVHLTFFARGGKVTNPYPPLAKSAYFSHVDIEQTQHHWSGSLLCLHHKLYSGNVAMAYTVKNFKFRYRIALSCLLSPQATLQARPKISN